MTRGVGAKDTVRAELLEVGEVEATLSAKMSEDQRTYVRGAVVRGDHVEVI